MVDPCCGLVSLQRGAILMGILSVVRAISCLLCTSAFLTIYVNSEKSIFEFLEKNNISIQFPHLPRITVIGLTSFMISVFIFEIPLYASAAFFAFKGNQERSNQWWKTKCILLYIAAGFGVTAMILSEDRVIIVGILGVALIYDFYLIWVIRAYAQEK